MIKNFLIFLSLCGCLQADLIDGFAKFADQKSSKQTQLKSNNLESELAQIFISQMPNLQIKNLKFKEQNLTNCEIISATQIHPSGIIRARCSGKNVFLHYVLDANVNVLMLQKDVQANEILDPSSVRVVQMPLGSISVGALGKLPLNAVSKSRLRANTLLKKTNLAPNWVILKGSNVNVKIKDGALSVFVIAQALSNAQINQILRLKLANKKIITARAVAKDQAIAL